MDSKHARIMATSLMREHGLGNWVFQFDRAKKRLGYCDSANRTISLSEPLTNACTDAEVKQTILHEIAHALTPMEYKSVMVRVNGRMVEKRTALHHGPNWLAKARSIGYTGGRTASIGGDIPTRYQATCKCGKKFGRDRMAQHRTYYCPDCRSRRDPFAGLLVWTDTKENRMVHSAVVRETQAAQVLRPNPTLGAAARSLPVVKRPRSAKGGDTYNGHGKFDRGFTDVESLFGDE